jgi:hypothetical protein
VGVVGWGFRGSLSIDLNRYAISRILASPTEY